MKKLILIFFFALNLFALEIKQMPIEFSQNRVELTKEYIKKSYGLDVENIVIVPQPNNLWKNGSAIFLSVIL